MTITVQGARVRDLIDVLDDIRPADLRECYASTGKPIWEAGLECLRQSEVAKVALRDGVPVVFWGARADGVVWLFATTQSEKCQFSLHRVLRPQLNELLETWPSLECWSDSRNTLHHTWLEWLGFTLVEEIALAPFGMWFKHYRKDRPCVPLSQP